MLNRYKTTTTALLLALMLAGPAQARICPPEAPALADRLAEAFAQSGDGRIAAWSAYLNTAFYSDLACLLASAMSPEEASALASDPVRLIEALTPPARPRNQSDALLMILLAMKGLPPVAK